MTARKLVPRRCLGKTNLQVSTIGIGGASFGGVYTDVSLDDNYKMVEYALNNGINIFDTSPYYGFTKSETNMGKILTKINQNTNHNRSSYYICTKVGRYGADKFDFSEKRCLSSIEESLNRLQTDYIDVINIHDFEFAQNLEQIYQETLPFLDEYRKKYPNKLKYIGLSGKQLPIIDYVAYKFDYNKIDTFLTYNKYNLCDTTLLQYLYRINKYNIGIIQGGFAYMGILSNRGPAQWNPYSKIFKDICKDTVNKINKLYNKDDGLERLACLYTHSLNNISTIVCGASNINEIEKNIGYVTENNDINKLLTGKDHEIIKYIQNELFADIMNTGHVEVGTEHNLIKAIVNRL